MYHDDPHWRPDDIEVKDGKLLISSVFGAHGGKGDIGQLITQLDKNGDGMLSKVEFRDGMKEYLAQRRDLDTQKEQTRLLKRIVFALLVTMLITVVVVFGLTIAAVELSKDTKVGSNGVLQDTDGNPISTETLVDKSKPSIDKPAADAVGHKASMFTNFAGGERITAYVGCAAGVTNLQNFNQGRMESTISLAFNTGEGVETAVYAITARRFALGLEPTQQAYAIVQDKINGYLYKVSFPDVPPYKINANTNLKDLPDPCVLPVELVTEDAIHSGLNEGRRRQLLAGHEGRQLLQEKDLVIEDNDGELSCSLSGQFPDTVEKVDTTSCAVIDGAYCTSEDPNKVDATGSIVYGGTTAMFCVELLSSECLTATYTGSPFTATGFCYAITRMCDAPSKGLGQSHIDFVFPSCFDYDQVGCGAASTSNTVVDGDKACTNKCGYDSADRETLKFDNLSEDNGGRQVYCMGMNGGYDLCDPSKEACAGIDVIVKTGGGSCTKPGTTCATDDEGPIFLGTNIPGPKCTKYCDCDGTPPMTGGVCPTSAPTPIPSSGDPTPAPLSAPTPGPTCEMTCLVPKEEVCSEQCPEAEVETKCASPISDKPGRCTTDLGIPLLADGVMAGDHFCTELLPNYPRCDGTSTLFCYAVTRMCGVETQGVGLSHVNIAFGCGMTNQCTGYSIGNNQFDSENEHVIAEGDAACETVCGVADDRTVIKWDSMPEDDQGRDVYCVAVAGTKAASSVGTDMMFKTGGGSCSSLTTADCDADPVNGPLFRSLNIMGPDCTSSPTCVEGLPSPLCVGGDCSTTSA